MSTRTLPAAVGRFRVDGLLGTGAFSAVYLAADDRIGSAVAIKLLADHHSLDPDIRERFIAEARLLRRLTSPHVVRLYELDETTAHQPFHVLEYVAGGNLAAHRRARLEAGASVTAADLAHVASDLAAALGVLHAERIVHRDLAPKNLLVRPAPDVARGDGGQDRTRDGGRHRNDTGDGGPGNSTGDGATGNDDVPNAPLASGDAGPHTGQGARRSAAAGAPGVMRPGEQLVLADLGISKDLADSSGFTAAAGTLGYAAPEQRTVGTVDERVDVYAASAVLAWMITGEHPTEYAAGQLADSVTTAGFAPALADVLIGGLAHDPAARPPTIARWHADVLDALGDPVAAAGDVGPTTPTTPDVPTAGRAAARRARGSSPRSRLLRAGTTNDAQRSGATTGPATADEPAVFPIPASPAMARPRRRWLIAIVVAVLAIVGAAGGIAIDRALRSNDDPGATTVEELDDGQVRVAQTNGEIIAAFTAPATLRPGETARVIAEVEGTADWVWIIPTARTAGTQRIDLTAPASGSITLRLVAIGADGSTAEAAYTFPVVADG